MASYEIRSGDQTAESILYILLQGIVCRELGELRSLRAALRMPLGRRGSILEVPAPSRSVTPQLLLGAEVLRRPIESTLFPTVIRLVRYVHVPRRFRRQVTHTFLFARDDYSCQYCGKHRSDLRGRQFLTRDHILPRSRGGLNAWDNVVTSCSPCNNRKGDRLPAEAGLMLRRTPKEPNYVHLVWVVRRVSSAQAKYIRMFYGNDALDVVSPQSSSQA